MTGDKIFKAVLAAMQPAEELGGPEGQEYVDLMERIAKEAAGRSLLRPHSGDRGPHGADHPPRDGSLTMPIDLSTLEPGDLLVNHRGDVREVVKIDRPGAAGLERIWLRWVWRKPQPWCRRPAMTRVAPLHRPALAAWLANGGARLEDWTPQTEEARANQEAYVRSWLEREA